MTDDDEARRLEALWGGSFGDEYVERNFDDGSGRTPFWRHVLNVIAPKTVLEVGCNVGGNLRCLSGLLGPENLAGVDINEAALAALAGDAPEIRTALAPARSLPFADGAFDLVFTTGVLIHQPPDTLPAVIDEIVRCSARFVVCGEYFAERVEELPYRGETGALFRGDFGSMYTERGLDVLERGFLPRDSVWDDLTYWILAKPRD